MKKCALLILPVVASVAFGLATSKAGSAVALGPHNQLATAYGEQIKKEEKRALENARRKFGSNVRILAFVGGEHSKLPDVNMAIT